ncbi:hypothetical protein [Pendulispora albinea]|uniref:Uncharacterized protein n=1 Tax=Pendulispora albinea TaxID=2741071 RepID=A0ABZ2LJP4_9BACT
MDAGGAIVTDDGGVEDAAPSVDSGLRFIGSRLSFSTAKTDIVALCPAEAQTGDLLVAAWIIRTSGTPGYIIPPSWGTLGTAHSDTSFPLWVGHHTLESADIPESGSDIKWKFPFHDIAAHSVVQVLAFRATARLQPVKPVRVDTMVATIDGASGRLTRGNIGTQGQTIGLFVVSGSGENMRFSENLPGLLRDESNPNLAVYRTGGVFPKNATIPGPTVTFAASPDASMMAWASLGVVDVTP